MVFKNEAQLKDFLLKKCEVALRKSQEQVYDIVNKFVRDFYNDYSPELYERTYQLYRSLVKSRIIPTSNGYKAEVYFDIGSLYYITGNKPTGEEVMEAAKHGFHGAIGNQFLYRHGDTGVGLWNDPMQIVDAQAINILKKELVANGIPIKY